MATDRMSFSPSAWHAVRSDAARRLVGAEMASLVGDFMVLAAMPFGVLALGGSAAQIGVVMAAQGVGLAITLPLGGVVGDRWDRRQVMLAADLIRLVSQGLIAVLFLTGAASLWELVATQLIHGIATGMFMPAATALVPDVVPPADIRATNGLKAMGRALAGSAGPLLGALAVAVADPGVAMGVDAATFGVSAALLAGLGAVRQAQSADRHGRRTVTQELRDGWREFWRRNWLRTVTIQFALVNAVVVAPFFVLGPVIADDSFGGATSWALILGFLAAGKFVGGLATASWDPGRPLVTATCVYLLWAAPLVLLALRAPLVPVLLGVAAAGVAEAGFDVLWETTVTTHVSSRSRSRLASVEMFGSLVFVPLGFLTAGWLEESIGTSATLLLGASTLVCASGAVLLFPSVRQLTSRAPGEAEGSIRRLPNHPDRYLPDRRAA